MSLSPFRMLALKAATARWSSLARHHAAYGRYQNLTRGSENRRIFGAMIVVGLALVGVKIVAMIKDLFVATSFGAGAEIDALLIALVLPSFVINLIAGSFSAAFVPAYVRLHAGKGRAAANRMLATVSLASMGLLALALGLLALVIPFGLPMLSTGFDPEARELSLRLSYLVLPCVLLSGAATLWSAVLNAHDQFAIAEISEVAVPLCMIFGVVLGGVRYGVYSLAIGYVIGYALQLTLLTVSLWKKRLLIVPRWYGWDADVRLVVSQYLPVLGGGLLLGTAPLIDQAMAASLGAGSVASLGYGTKVVGLVLMVGSISVSRAVLPAFSRMVAASDYGAVRQTLRLYTRLILMVGLPVTMGLIVASEPITRLIFERGAFTAEDTGRVAVIQTMSALQIPFYILAMLYVRLISAIRANHILLIGTAISFVINLSMDYYLKEVMGVAGIALSTTLVYVVSLCFLGVMLFRRLRTEGNA